MLSTVAAIGITAVAMAMGGGGPKPPQKPLDDAVHDGLTAPEVPGISARIDFENNLVDASSLQGADPPITGATGRLWASPEGDGKLRLELQAEDTGGGDSELLVDGRNVRFYDSARKRSTKGRCSKKKRRAARSTARPGCRRSKRSWPKPKRVSS